MVTSASTPVYRTPGFPVRPLLLGGSLGLGDDERPQGAVPVANLLVEGISRLHIDVFEKCFEGKAGRDGR